MGEREFWDEAAATFDDEADHGLADESVRDDWTRLLLPLLPAAPTVVADLGCGTGSLSVLLGAAGHRLLGLDFSPRMLRVAQTKAVAAAVHVNLVLGDASDPPLRSRSFGGVVVRHLLWALPDAADALRRWRQLLRPEGTLILIEGRWESGAGIPAQVALDLARHVARRSQLIRLHDPGLWGRPVTDERYLLVLQP